MMIGNAVMALFSLVLKAASLPKKGFRCVYPAPRDHAQEPMPADPQ